MKDFNNMVKSGTPFARKFPREDKVLDRIDRELLHRSEGRFTPGACCDWSFEGGVDLYLSRVDDSVFEPGPGAERLLCVEEEGVLLPQWKLFVTLLQPEEGKDRYVPRSKG